MSFPFVYLLQLAFGDKNRYSGIVKAATSGDVVKLCCYVYGCINPIVSKNTMACADHVKYACEIFDKRVSLVRDHDHACHKDKRMCTKCFRGHLCPQCNTGLGMFRDNADLLRNAADYLERDRLD